MEKRTEKLSRILNELNIDGYLLQIYIIFDILLGLLGQLELLLRQKMEIFSFRILDTRRKRLNKLVKWDLNLWKFHVAHFRQLENI